MEDVEFREFLKVQIDFIKSGGDMELLPEGYHIKPIPYNQSVILYNDKYQYEIPYETFVHLQETN